MLAERVGAIVGVAPTLELLPPRPCEVARATCSAAKARAMDLPIPSAEAVIITR